MKQSLPSIAGDIALLDLTAAIAGHVEALSELDLVDVSREAR